MNQTRWYFWAPRIISILFAGFLSLFALDVFTEGYSIGETLLALVMHLIPTFVVVVCLIIAWQREWVGAILFIAMAIFYLIISKGGSWIISGPLFIIGILFQVAWRRRSRSK